jgi:DNA processing protein
MNDLLDFVALSLLPPWSWLRIAERLRAGDPPGAVLRQLAAGRARGEPDCVSTLRSEADAAIGRARAQAIIAVPWNDVAYPVALTTIADPPPVLWTRGRLDALSAPAVAIVGSVPARARVAREGD